MDGMSFEDISLSAYVLELIKNFVNVLNVYVEIENKNKAEFDELEAAIKKSSSQAEKALDDQFNAQLSEIASNFKKNKEAIELEHKLQLDFSIEASKQSQKASDEATTLKFKTSKITKLSAEFVQAVYKTQKVNEILQSKIVEYRKIASKVLGERLTSVEVRRESKQAELNNDYKSEKQKLLSLTNDKYDDAHREFITNRKNNLNYLLKNSSMTFNNDEIRAYLSSVSKNPPKIDGFGCATGFPNFIRLGTLKYSLNKFLKFHDIAALLTREYNHLLVGDEYIELPFCMNLQGGNFSKYIQYNKSTADEVISGVQALIMNLLMSIEPGKARFTFIDPVRLGKTFGFFHSLREVNEKIINGDIFTTEESILKQLLFLVEHLKNINIRCLQGNRYKNITEYNKVAKIREPYEFVFVMDFPSRLTKHSLEALRSIVTDGEKNGVYTFIISSAVSLNRDFSSAMDVVTSDQFCFLNHQIDGVAPILSFAQFPGAKKLAAKVMPVLSEGMRHIDRVEIKFEDILGDLVASPKRWFYENSATGLSVPIGLWGANYVQVLELGHVGTKHHAMIAGTTGAGKSVLLHTIIMSALLRYGPDDLQLYLIDFKRGVEFKVYADYYLPQIKVLAIESDTEFGLSVLQSIDSEMNTRKNLFDTRILGTAKNISVYREKTHAPLPRILLVFDEFDDLFSGSSAVTSECVRLLDNIITQGRAFGVHAILASQSIEMATAISRPTLNEVAIRIALKCNEAAARFILGTGEHGVSQLSDSDPGQAIFNDSSGNEKSSKLFRVAYANNSESVALLEKISEEAKLRHMAANPFVLVNNIESNLMHPFNQFINGASISLNGTLRIGEALKLTERLRVELKRRNLNNLLLIGNNEVKARGIFVLSMLSRIVDYASIHKSPPAKPIITILDFISNDAWISEEEPLRYLCGKLKAYIAYYEPEDTEEALATAHGFISDDTAEQHLFMLFGLGLARFESTGLTGLYARYMETGEQFNEILANGPEKGVNSIIWNDTFESFRDRYMTADRVNLLPHFSQRIAFDLSDDGFKVILDDASREKPGEKDAVFYQRFKKNIRIRPYITPSIEWLESIIQKIV
jgi:hypothetical protein